MFDLQNKILQHILHENFENEQIALKRGTTRRPPACRCRDLGWSWTLMCRYTKNLPTKYHYI